MLIFRFTLMQALRSWIGTIGGIPKVLKNPPCSTYEILLLLLIFSQDLFDALHESGKGTQGDALDLQVA